MKFHQILPICVLLLTGVPRGAQGEDPKSAPPHAADAAIRTYLTGSMGASDVSLQYTLLQPDDGVAGPGVYPLSIRIEPAWLHLSFRADGQQIDGNCLILGQAAAQSAALTECRLSNRASGADVGLKGPELRDFWLGKQAVLVTY